MRIPRANVQCARSAPPPYTESFVKRALRNLFWNSGLDNAWTGWAAFLAFMLVGAAARSAMPESAALPLIAAFVGAFVAGYATYRLEFADRG